MHTLHGEVSNFDELCFLLIEYRANAFMNSWNSEEVRSLYDKQNLGFLTNFNGQTRLHPTRVAIAFRQLVLDEGADPNDVETLRKAREESRHAVNPKIPFETLNWGCFTMMLSELGKQMELNDLLDYADSRLNPTWESGGLFYPRNDILADADWNLTHVEPHSGNSGIAYSRLNVKDGQKTMWNEPWTSEMLSKRPWIDGIGFADGVDFLRAFWDEDLSAMVLTLKRWQGGPKSITLYVRNLPAGRWDTYVNGSLQQTEDFQKPSEVALCEIVGTEVVDIIIQMRKN